ncbi:PTS sugar transporter subunit IIA [Cellulomonas hominis]
MSASDPAASDPPLGGAPTLRILSPVAGTVRPLAEVPDPVFAQEIVGPGLAVEPLLTQTQRVLAPVDGTVAAVHPHAFALEVPGGRAVLVHLGIDTVGLAGQGFTVHVSAGQTVSAGDRLLTWSPLDVHAAGLSTLCPVIALSAGPGTLEPLVAPGDTVAAGTPLLDWRG